jgi:glycosyltransferase involved in cell wall biosynthesis
MSSPGPSHDLAGRVSVVVPAYRSAATILRAIDSVLAQTYAAAEIIVVDDGSPDEQAALVERTYGPRVTLLRGPNGGAASARNKGIERATGDYIAFLDADDYWEADKLALQLALFHRHPELGLVAGAFFEETPGGPRDTNPVRNGPRSWYGHPLNLKGRAAFRLSTIVWTGTVLVRREALGTERFVSGLEPAEDRDLWMRVVSRQSTYLTAEPLATAVLVQGSLSRTNAERDCSSMLRVIARNRESLGPIGSRLWRSHTLYRWATLDANPRTALPRLLQSLVLWPIPYTGFLHCRFLGRMKRLFVLLVVAGRRVIRVQMDEQA